MNNVSELLNGYETLPERCISEEMGGGVQEKWAISEFRNSKLFRTCETPSCFGSKTLPFRKITTLCCHLKFRNLTVLEVRNVYKMVGVMQFIGEK